jgi:ABC-type lipoprotein release transport system permease subunit
VLCLTKSFLPFVIFARGINDGLRARLRSPRYSASAWVLAALIVAFALSNGFRDEMRDKILQGTAHLSVLRTDGRAIENYENSQTA